MFEESISRCCENAASPVVMSPENSFESLVVYSYVNNDFPSIVYCKCRAFLKNEAQGTSVSAFMLVDISYKV